MNPYPFLRLLYALDAISLTGYHPAMDREGGETGETGELHVFGSADLPRLASLTSTIWNPEKVSN